MNGDNYINVTDLISLLGIFDTYCDDSIIYGCTDAGRAISIPTRTQMTARVNTSTDVWTHWPVTLIRMPAWRIPS